MVIRGNFKAALFDLDGVVFDTEKQYTRFWASEARRYHPEVKDLEYLIKGQTLYEILSRFFGDVSDKHHEIISRLNDFERKMTFEYVNGFEDFVGSLRAMGLKIAIVTSSNNEKMAQIYRQIPEFKPKVDIVLTADDFEESKPNPQCYLKAASIFGVEPNRCLVFEDSFNGLKAGRAAGMTVIGLTTSNSADSISSLSDYVIPDFSGLQISL